MIKVCHIVPSYFPYYPAPYEFAKNEKKLGFDVDVISLKRKGEYERQNISGINVYRLIENQRSIFSNVESKKIFSLFKERNYNIIHVYAFRNCFLLPIKYNKFKYNWVFDLRSNNLYGNKVVSNIADIYTMIESMFYNKCIAISKSVGNRVFKGFKNFSVVESGVNISRYEKDDTYPYMVDNNFNIKFVYVGTLNKKRKLYKVLHSFKVAFERNNKIKLYFIGDGNAKNDLVELSKKININNNVEFLGYIEYDDIGKYLTAFNAAISYIPNNYQFNLQPPNKTIEYLAAKLPTIATGTKGNREIIKHLYNGVIINDDIIEMADAITELSLNKKLRQYLSKNARMSVCGYDWNNIVKNKLIKVYKSLVY